MKAEGLASGPEATAAPAPAVTRSWRRLWRNKVSLFAICTIVFLAAVAALGPWIAPYDPDEPDLAAVFAPPQWSHWLGADDYGRDELSRIIAAARVDLIVPFASTFAALFVGSVIGAIAGYRGGWLDQLVMRCVDAVMAFPAFILAMGLAAAMGNSVTSLTIVIAITQAPVYLRQLRGDMVRVRELEYAEAALVVGNPPLRIIFVHLFPNCFPPLIVQATLSMGFALLTLAALSFIGLGIQPPNAEWGEMTSEGASLMVTGEWWLSLFPGLAIMCTVLAFNLVGDALRDVLDPRMRGVK